MSMDVWETAAPPASYPVLDGARRGAAGRAMVAPGFFAPAADSRRTVDGRVPGTAAAHE